MVGGEKAIWGICLKRENPGQWPLRARSSLGKKDLSKKFWVMALMITIKKSILYPPGYFDPQGLVFSKSPLGYPTDSVGNTKDPFTTGMVCLSVPLCFGLLMTFSCPLNKIFLEFGKSFGGVHCDILIYSKGRKNRKASCQLLRNSWHQCQVKFKNFGCQVSFLVIHLSGGEIPNNLG